MAGPPELQAPPDGADRLGSPAWLEATGGRLTWGERTRLTAAIYAQLPKAAWHRLRAVRWRRRPSKGDVAFDFAQVPQTDFANDALRRAESMLGSEAMLNHSYRAWAFGRALALRDDVQLHNELFFVAAMLHDVGLARPVYETCFTKTGSDAAAEVGERWKRTSSEIAVVQSAISHHITPGVTARAGGVHGVYMQAGTLLDLGGLDAVHLPVDWVQAVCDRWPTLGANREAGSRWRAEAAMVRRGRAHLLQRRACFSVAARMTPIPPRRSHR